MPATLWRLDQHIACLEAERLHARLNWQHPANGLIDVCLEKTKVAGAGLLGVKMAADFICPPGFMSEGYFRGADFIAAYEQAQFLPGRVDALWRVPSPRPDDFFLAAVDLIVSVRTYLLESRAEIAVESRLPETEMLRLVDADTAEFARLSGESAKAMILSTQDGLGCVVFRLPEGEISYAEMVHPVDFQHDELEADLAAGRFWLLRHRLFSVPLEKGVLLRCRVRGAFFPRHDDLRATAACYRAFAAAQPPLNA
jgi:hypothetical protein